MQSRKVINIQEVSEMTGLSASTIKRLEKKNHFPKRIQISFRRIGWDIQEIQQWITSRRESIKPRKEELWS